MKSSLYSEVLDKETFKERVVLVEKQREYIKTHLDLLGLKYDAIVVTLIREQLDKDYRAIDVAVAYGHVYHNKYLKVKSIDVPLAEIVSNYLLEVPTR